ncbi:hypothetical protein EJ04DRAFT_294376 [Polyplosphaeria fusca]|uniref:Uncharacterized protein n=1 Tax=Polyplosphaeria fusca TaxID=682080 RepID=A0A9P4R5P7_9PLEO|nr:hypothetical protein EJ04DRAFT_294376 [Polyplosphaeria fusca]
MSFRALPQSADRKTLFAKLGLNDQVHRLMLEEAARSRDRLSIDPQNLTPHAKSNARVAQPYKWDQLSEMAKYSAQKDLAKYASEYTKPYYEQGWWTNGDNEENWVARWYLWHSFRYRDNRDNRGQVCE